MSEELKNIFDDFDPGVNDEHVERRWQAIRPLLPREDSRERVLLLTRKGKFRALVIAATLLIASFVSVVFFRETTVPQNSGFGKKEKAISQGTQVKAGTDGGNRNSTAKTGNRKEAFVEERHSPQQSIINSIQAESSISVAARKAGAIRSTPQPQQVVTQTRSVNESGGPDPITAMPAEETSGPANEVVAGISPEEENPAFLVPVQSTLSTGKERETFSRFTEVRPKANRLPGRWSIEVFGGADRYNNSYQNTVISTFATTKADASQSTVYSNGLSWLAGAAAHRWVGTRVFIPLQILYTGAQDVMSEVNEGSIRITQPVTTTQLDSNVMYRNFTEVLEVRQQNSVRFGLGFGVRLFASPLFTINAMALGELTQATYLRTNTVSFYESETPVPSGQPNSFTSSQGNASPGYEPNSSASYKKNNYNAVVTLHAARTLRHRLAITSRLSYHYSILKNELPGKRQDISFRPRDLMLSVGLSYRW